MVLEDIAVADFPFVIEHSVRLGADSHTACASVQAPPVRVGEARDIASM